MTQLAPLDRTAIRTAYRQEEEACVEERLKQAKPVSSLHRESSALAARLIAGARERKASGIDAFLHAYGLATEEGIALMYPITQRPMRSFETSWAKSTGGSTSGRAAPLSSMPRLSR